MKPDAHAKGKRNRKAAHALYLSGHSPEQVAAALGVSYKTALEYKPYAMQHRRAGVSPAYQQAKTKISMSYAQRRREIVALFWTGLTSAEIAPRFGLASRTVEDYKPKALKRTGGRNPNQPCADTQPLDEGSPCQPSENYQKNKAAFPKTLFCPIASTPTATITPSRQSAHPIISATDPKCSIA